jgi:hypothetical protein
MTTNWYAISVNRNPFLVWFETKYHDLVSSRFYPGRIQNKPKAKATNKQKYKNIIII